MHIVILEECGYREAMYGLSLSYKLGDWRDAEPVARKLYNKHGGHNKFLESIQVWLEVSAPRYWWQHADTYRVGESKQSESTMHTLMKFPFEQRDFEKPIKPSYLKYLEGLRKEKNFEQLSNDLPEGYLQRRIWNLNYMVIRNIVSQRRSHKRPEWRYFCTVMTKALKYREFLQDLAYDEKGN
jgi:hypothetical protein